MLIPAAELAVEDTWRTAGMRGTASSTLVGTRGEALSSVPFGLMPALCLTGPLPGLGRAALEAVVSAAASEPLSITHRLGSRASDHRM